MFRMMSIKWLLVLQLIIFLPSLVFADVGQQTCTSGTCVLLDGLNIATVADGTTGAGLISENNGTLTTGNNISIATQGNNGAAGIIARSFGTVSLSSTTNSTIKTTGTGPNGGSPAILITDGGNVTLNGYNIQTTGAGSVGVKVMKVSNSATNFLTLNNSTLHSNGDALTVLTPDTHAIFTINNSSISSDNNVVYSSTNSGLVAEINASNSQLSGDIWGSGISTVNLFLNNNTIWTGSTSNNPAHMLFSAVLSPSTTWNMTGSSVIHLDLTHGGTINFPPPANPTTFSTLTTGLLFGMHGQMNMHSFLQGDGSPSDLLIIAGPTSFTFEDAVGVTGLSIQNFGGAGDLTTKNGILVVLALPDVTTAPTAFFLANAPVAGPYEYSLVRGSVADNSGPENWYLHSEGQYSPLIPLRYLPFPFYRSEVSLYSTLPSLAILYTRGIMSTLHQRISQQNFSLSQECGTPEFAPGAWFRFINGGGDINNGSIFEEGANFKYHYLALEAGFDLFHQNYTNGGRDYSGFLLVVGDATSNVRHYNTISAGENSIFGNSLGAYYTYYGPTDWYLDGVLMGNRFDMEAKPPAQRGVPAVAPLGNSLAASIEGGYPLHINDKTSIEPQAQVIYQTLAVEDVTDTGGSVKFNRTQSWLSRVGLLVGKTWCPHTGFLHNWTDKISGWARLNYWHEASGKSVVKFTSNSGLIPFHSELAGNFFQADFGISTQATKSLSFYADAGEGIYLENKGRFYNVDAGFRINL